MDDKKKKTGETTPKTAEFLIELHKNVQMAKYALEEVLKVCKDENLRKTLLLQYHDFEKSAGDIVGAIIELGETPKSATCMQNMMLKSSIRMSTVLDNSPSKIADMVIQGDNQGIMDINRLLNQSEVKEERAISLATALLETEQRHVDDLKKYL